MRTGPDPFHNPWCRSRRDGGWARTAGHYNFALIDRIYSSIEGLDIDEFDFKDIIRPNECFALKSDRSSVLARYNPFTPVSYTHLQRDGTWNSHVDLGLWADAMLIAPATASTIGKMANGVDVYKRQEE